MNAALIAFLTRLFFSTHFDKTMKVGAAVASARRGGLTATYDELNVLEELNVGYVAFSPLANGFLTGSYGKDSRFDAKTDYRSRMPQFSAEGIDQNGDLLALLHDLAADKCATPAQISLAWIIAKKPYLVPIPGSRKMERLRENAKSADLELTTAEGGLFPRWPGRQ